MENREREYYQALVERNREYEGVFFAGIKSTGIFCRPTCPARKPKFESCEFFSDAKAALLASYRPCLRCKPLSLPDQTTDVIEKLIKAVDQQPEKRWKEADLKELGIDSSTARRQFKKRYGMTFVEYARSRRMGIALGEIRSGKKIIEAQLSAGYESGSGFRDAFSRIMGAPPARSDQEPFYATWLDTPLGAMLAIADDSALWLLEFTDRRGLEKEVERLRKKTGRAILPGENSVTKQIQDELAAYFDCSLTQFKTPVKMIGTPFQLKVWDLLVQIPCGETISYSELAIRAGNPAAVRAVARANGTNQLALIIPCHRVIQRDGGLGGYAGGIARKEWLLKHEKGEK
ncbi:bifunctional transcriptional activator/DNA repair enzyme AdaA [Jeotgalibacillus sp. R-1-5s-1]|uniref:bifunctional transcriptional activator/DNA repair enzyme AdaA n=1 Tax=Jeotgalibacillus sp. R-1-5s-1 TaxID=2555897 RepID=UPI001ABC67E7|nr:methylated-DNA--[protein]-cysteine S-methyltransferase [Jeotgalibacillus sp. R-1-5s-1]